MRKKERKQHSKIAAGKPEKLNQRLRKCKPSGCLLQKNQRRKRRGYTGDIMRICGRLLRPPVSGNFEIIEEERKQ